MDRLRNTGAGKARIEGTVQLFVLFLKVPSSSLITESHLPSRGEHPCGFTHLVISRSLSERCQRLGELTIGQLISFPTGVSEQSGYFAAAFKLSAGGCPEKVEKTYWLRIASTYAARRV